MTPKLKSRKFLLTLLWNAFLMFGLVITVITDNDVFYISHIITFAGTITAAYIGVQGYKDAKGQ